MEEQRNEKGNQELMQLLVELSKLQFIKGKIYATKALRASGKKTKEIAKSTEIMVKEAGKRFGIKMENIHEQYLAEREDKNGIIVEYKQQVEQLVSQYDFILKEILFTKSQLEADEYAIILKEKRAKKELQNIKKIYNQEQDRIKEEIQELIENDDLSTAQNKMEELKGCKESEAGLTKKLEARQEEIKEQRIKARELVEECEAKYEQCLESRNDEIDKIANSKDNKLKIVSKQNIIQKIVGSIFNKINGAKKFARSVEEPLKAKIKQMKEETIPEMAQKIDERRTNFLNYVQKKKEDRDNSKAQSEIDYNTKLETVYGKINDFNQGVKTVADKGTEAVQTVKAGVVSIVEKGKNTPTYKSVLEKGNQINAHLIEKAAQIIEGEKIKVEQLQNENQTVYNDDKGTVVGEDSDEGRD